MEIADLLSTEQIACDVEVHSKKRVLEVISSLLAASRRGISPERIFDSLIGRERLGSTGLGHGVAIPHGRTTESDKAVGAFLRLQEPVDYDAIDNRPVDLVFALLVPMESTEDHLEILSKLARMFSNDRLCERLRAARDPQEMLLLLAKNASDPKPT